MTTNNTSFLPWQQSALKNIYYYNINNLNNDNIHPFYNLLYLIILTDLLPNGKNTDMTNEF